LEHTSIISTIGRVYDLMAYSALNFSDFALPTRLHDQPVRGLGSVAQFQLIERIAELPYVQTVERGGHCGPITACVFLQPDQRPARKQFPPVMLCQVSHTGISVEGLSDAERLEVLGKGWGRLEANRVQLFLPRNDSELEACWSILYRAYNSIINPPQQSPTAPAVLFGDSAEPSHMSLT
jgi:hypothetical protein